MTESSATRTAPLAGVRVLNLGGIWAGRVAAMLLADQGAEVIEIDRQGRDGRPEDALLGRGKNSITLDLATDNGRREALRLACEADIVIDNLGPGRAARFGLDHPTLSGINPGVVYLALPGFPSGTAEADLAAWEGTIAATVGVYTDLNSSAAILGEDPIFTALPMASAYGGVLGATAATLAHFHALRSGSGQLVEVPLADALLSAMAALAMRIEGQPEQFDLPRVDKVMKDVAFPIFRDLAKHLTSDHKAALKTYLKRFGRPQFGHHRCADGRQVFINAADHVHQARSCLEVLGILDQLVAEGMVVGSPFDESADGNNISSSVRLSPFWTQRLGDLMAARFLTRPAHEWQAALQEAGVPCSVVRTTDEWLDEPVAHASGWVEALSDPTEGPVVEAGRFITIEGDRIASPALGPRRFSVGGIGWTARPARPRRETKLQATAPMLSGLKVLDLANVIAAPAAARTLATFGADVIRVDAPASLAGPRMTMWYGVDVNQGKRAAIVDLKSPGGREILARLVSQADVVLHNFLDRSAEGIGISEAQLRAINPDIVCCQVTAWGGPNGGEWRNFPAFDPVLQAATGITSRYGTPEVPALHGIASCVDYITGFTAALGIAQALVARELGRGGSYVRTSLAMGAQLVQFPFVVKSDGGTLPPMPSGQDSKGVDAHYALYETHDGWAFLGCRRSDIAAVAGVLEATAADYAAMAEALRERPLAEVRKILSRFSQASIIEVRRLDSLPIEPREAAGTAIAPGFGTMTLAEVPHPSGYPTAVPLPTWFRCATSPVRRLGPSPPPGADTRDVLADIGIGHKEADALIAAGLVGERWAALKHYLSK